MPTLREFQELTEENREIVEKEAPPPPPSGTVEALADPGFKERLKQTDQASEAALADLEKAIETAEVTSKAAAKVLNPEAEPAPAAPETARGAE